MMQYALTDEEVSHVVFVLGDTLPLRPLSVMRRDHAELFLDNQGLLSEMIPWTDCEEEDMFYWSLKTRKADLIDRCVMMAQWDDRWPFSKVKRQCECPEFLKCAVSRLTDESPSEYRNV